MVRNLDSTAETHNDHFGKRGIWDPYEFYKQQIEEKSKEEEEKKALEEKTRREKEEKERDERILKADEEIKKQREDNHKVFEELRTKILAWKGRDKEQDGSRKVR
jgi:membrane protein involved in colicin uptake